MTKDEQIKLIEENKMLVPHIINTYYPVLAMDDDAMQIGLIALWKATIYYNPELSKFSTYAGQAIKFNLAKYIVRKNIEVPMLSTDALLMEKSEDQVDSGILRPAPRRPVWVGPPVSTLLTERQMDILRLRKDEWSYRDIGERIGISRTVVMKEIHRIKNIIDDNILYI